MIEDSEAHQQDDSGVEDMDKTEGGQGLPITTLLAQLLDKDHPSVFLQVDLNTWILQDIQPAPGKDGISISLQSMLLCCASDLHFRGMPGLMLEWLDSSVPPRTHTHTHKYHTCTYTHTLTNCHANFAGDHSKGFFDRKLAMMQCIHSEDPTKADSYHCICDMYRANMQVRTCLPATHQPSCIYVHTYIYSICVCIKK